MYAYRETVATRWKDDDVYGHVDNAAHYSPMDIVINAWLVRTAGLDIHDGDAIGLCAESRCAYRATASFPNPLRRSAR
ncbi:hypothetical protein ACQPYK_34470 [Streptosporangium sp. CA-135522]|uniref:hypothetical protein n=1 Tax=Streptosporangium sp. CA-135522 TaxID=3240072 RepID=UPI003D8BDE70